MAVSTKPGRCIGIDHGSVRVGVAVSDPNRTVASPLPYVPAENALEDIADMTIELEASEVVVGLPLNMDGSWSDSTRAARDFATALRHSISVPVSTWDERLSTVAAGRALRDGGTKRRQRKAKVDSVAASLVLQSYLDSKRIHTAN